MNPAENHSPRFAPQEVDLRKRTLLLFLATLPAACATSVAPCLMKSRALGA